ncbi:hypothetical protein OF83DRAFT_882057 [Amylostereum chailletii]|nr:hypothetical protein OF83DRAFT_882057 [Amylostereum chailletii]
MSVEELAKVLAIDFDSETLPQYDPAYEVSNPEEAILAICSSLIVIGPGEVHRIQAVMPQSHAQGSGLEHNVDSHEQTSIKSVRKSSLVHFAHFSVLEYMTSAHLAQTSQVSFYHLDAKGSHIVMAQICLSIMETIKNNEDCTSYAGAQWVNHMQYEKTAKDPVVHALMKQLCDVQDGDFSLLWTTISMYLCQGLQGSVHIRSS